MGQEMREQRTCWAGGDWLGAGPRTSLAGQRAAGSLGDRTLGAGRGPPVPLGEGRPLRRGWHNVDWFSSSRRKREKWELEREKEVGGKSSLNSCSLSRGSWDEFLFNSLHFVNEENETRETASGLGQHWHLVTGRVSISSQRLPRLASHWTTLSLTSVRSEDDFSISGSHCSHNM